MAMAGKTNGKDDGMDIPEGLRRKAKPTYEELMAENERLKAAAQSAIKLKVSEKGGVSLYGLGRFPITAYAAQWERILDMADTIRAFIADHEGELSRK